MSMSPADKKKLQGMVQEIANAMIRMEMEREFIKDVLARAKDELEMKPKTVRSMAKIYYKNVLMELKMESEELFNLYEDVMAASSAAPPSEEDDD